MGDQSAAAGLSANALIGIGQQASVVTLQGLLGHSAADFKTGTDRLNQFMRTSVAQLKTVVGIIDAGSFAQTQVKLLEQSQIAQQKLVNQLGGKEETDRTILKQLLGSFQVSTGDSQDGAEQALIDCFTPVNAVSG